MTQFLHGQWGWGVVSGHSVPHIYCILYPYYYYIASPQLMKH